MGVISKGGIRGGGGGKGPVVLASTVISRVLQALYLRPSKAGMFSLISIN